MLADAPLWSGRAARRQLGRHLVLHAAAPPLHRDRRDARLRASPCRSPTSPCAGRRRTRCPARCTNVDLRHPVARAVRLLGAVARLHQRQADHRRDGAVHAGDPRAQHRRGDPRPCPSRWSRAADGMGYRPLRRFVAVELPLALPGIVAGLRLATVSTVSLISVGALIGRGGLGRLFADGCARGRSPSSCGPALIAVVVAGPRARRLLVCSAGRPGDAVDPCASRSRGDGVRTILDGFGWLTTADNWWGRNGIARGRPSSTSGTRSWPLAGACVIGLPIGLCDRAHRPRPLRRRQPRRAVAGDPDRSASSALLFRVAAADAVAGARRAASSSPCRRSCSTPRRASTASPPTCATRPGAWASPAWQALWQVEVPNALPLILAGIRSAANQVIATATIAGFVGLGTLGVFIFSGQRHAALRRRRRRVDRRDRPRAARRGWVRAAATRRRVAWRACAERQRSLMV